MNTTKYMQTDSRWSSLGYPKSPCTIGNSGCGEVSIVNCIIEMEKYKNYTPKTIQPNCKQYAAPNCDGTYWSGIPAMMKRYGLTEVKEHANMPSLWKELAKGERVAIYLMGSRLAGTKKVRWTSGGHFVCSTDYKVVSGKHIVYVKDSYSNASSRNGYISYEDNMAGAILKVWSGKLTKPLYNKAEPTPKPAPTPTPTPTIKLTVDGIGGTNTVRRMQQFFKTPIDGVIGGQNANYKTLYPSLQSVQYGKGGSQCVIALQKWLGLSKPDGVIGKNTTTAWQKKLRELGYLAKSEKIDGIIGVKSMKAWQECLNNEGKKKVSSTSPTTTKPSTSTTKTPQQKMCAWAKSIADGKKYKYKKFTDDKKTQQCPICHNLTGKYKGWNCIGFAFASWKHGAGLKSKCSCGVIPDGIWNKILKAKTDAEALKIAQERTGLNDIKVIRNGGKAIPQSKLKAGDIVACFKGNSYYHTVLYMGDGKIAECTTGKTPEIGYNRALSKSDDKVAIRYTGK